MQKIQRGFTLIELIIVIVILGVLAAVVLPKFVDLGGDARQAVMKSVEGSMRSANAIIYAKSAANGTLGAPAGTIIVNGQTVNTAYGFAASVSPDLNLLLDMSPASDFAVASGTITHAKAKTAASCVVTYTKPTAVDGTPTYVSTLSGC